MPNEYRSQEQALRDFAAFQVAAKPILEAAMARIADEAMSLARHYGVTPVIQIEARLPTVDEWELAQEDGAARLPGERIIPIDYAEARRRGRKRTEQIDQTARLN